jgi:hypothetical protein
VSSCWASNFLFFLVAHHFITKQETTVNPHPAMMIPPPVWYLGSCDLRKK